MKTAWTIVAIAMLASTAAAQDVLRTGDSALRGLKATDFPRVKQLASNVEN